MNNSQVAEILTLLIKPLVGQVCTQVGFSYGDELVLDFGELSNYDHPKLSHLKKGEWRLFTRTTNWILYQSNKRIIFSENLDNENKNLIKQLKNKALISFVCSIVENESDNRLYLTFKFEDYYTFYLQCNLNNDTTLAHFELFMPNNKVLIFGPKLDWEYKSSK